MVRRASIVLGLAALVVVALASSSSGQAQGPPGGSPPGLDKAIAAKQKHADRMLDKPGVAGIGVALNGAGKPVIRIYKEKQDVADLPAELEGVPVDSVTTGIIEPRDHSPSHRFPRPVPIGVSAGLSGVATGTLGVRVTDGTNVYALSNNHVFAGINSASIGDAIISPGDVDGGVDPDDIIGTLAAYETIDFDGGDNTMDAAIALTSPANVATSTPADGYGTPSPLTAPAFLGQAVQKYGRTTGLQLGNVAATNVSVDVCYLVLFDFCLQEARFVAQISVSPGTFSAPGDSGSLIVTQGGNQPVALLFAGGDGLTIGSPIDAVLQRFGVTIDGSTPPDGPPGAPTSLAASPGDTSASLSWSAPSFIGGSPITGYRVYRDTSPNPTTALTPDLGVVTSYVDTGLTNGTTYYYKVSALNANGEGPLSNQAQVTPIALVPPSAPLPTLDNFDDGFENPLSDQGRWSNGVSGGEAGLYVPSVWLACSIATTCTGWRNDTQYGPDSEVWARLSVLPGNSNQLRLYARLQQPGTPTYDSYMLRTTQLSGTDQVSLERVDNGTIVTLLTMNQELVAGDLLLLRAMGSTLEAWRHNGSWARLGFVTDSTYAAAGYVGVGLRGTTGRADDFGARTMGAPPPDTEPPGPPGTLTATPASATQIDLAWQEATDNVGVTLYRLERCEGASCSNFAEIATTTGLSYANSGLSGSTPYTYRVRAEDAAENPGPYSNEASATTPAPPDTEPPGPPGNLTATALSSSQIDVAWQAATDNVGVTVYRIERCEGAGCSNFAEIAASTATSHLDVFLTASTAYTYRVRAEDAAENLGPYSNEASATTPAPPDTEPPGPPGTLTATPASATAVDLSWGAASDNVGVVLYRIERCEGASCSNFSEIATTTSLTYADSALAASSTYSYRVRGEDAVPLLGPYSNVASATTHAAPRPLYFSLLSNGTVGGLSVANEDIVSFDGATSFGLAFDGSDVGLSSRRLDAFSWLDTDTLVFSLDTDGATLPGITGTIDDSDLVRFDASSLGATTSGTFSLYFDGSDVGLTTNAEDVDAFELLANGQLLLSTQGSVGVTGVSGADEDLLAFTPGTLGETTSGTFGMYFDGSDVGLSTSSDEDVDAAAVDAAGRIYLSTLGGFAVTGASGADEDVFVFTPATLGTSTTGTFDPTLYFDGSAFGLAANDVFAIDLPAGL